VPCYISTKIDIDIAFWLSNKENLDYEYAHGVSHALAPYFAEIDLSEVQVTAGSSVAVVSWLNTPAELLSNAERIYSVLPDATSTGCYEFPNTFLLGQQAASGCVVTILRKCFDGALVEYFSGVCPTANPTVKPSLPTTATPTVAVTEPPAVLAANALQSASKVLALSLNRNVVAVVSVVGALFFLACLLCCFLQYRRSKKVKEAIVELKTVSDSLFLAEQTYFASLNASRMNTGNDNIEMIRVGSTGLPVPENKINESFSDASSLNASLDSWDTDLSDASLLRQKNSSVSIRKVVTGHLSPEQSPSAVENDKEQPALLF